MPFASKAQMRWMYATDPKMAKRWTKEQKKSKGKKSFKKLPEKVKRTRDDFCLFFPMLIDGDCNE